MKEIRAQIFEYDVNLMIDDNLTLVNGDSGIGKTLLFNYFDRQSYSNSEIHCFNSRYVEKLKTSNESMYRVLEERLRKIRNSLIVIDNAEVVLDDKIRKQIAFDGSNTYIIFGRNVSGLWITEHNIASLIRDNKKKQIYLDYYFKDVNKK